MATMIGKGIDVVAFLKAQHQQIKTSFECVLDYHGKDREQAFVTLRRLMAIHETAEEEIVHPAARKAMVNGSAIVEKRLEEEKAAKTALAELERLHVDSTEFESKLRTLHENVLKHAEAEESEEFDLLGAALPDDKLERMTKAVEIAESIAPTRPHAGIESMAANVVVGPFASMVDRARDAIAGKG